MDPTILWTVLIVMGLLGLYVLLEALGAAVVMFGIAAEHGVRGVLIYIALWVFAFPLMAAVSVILAIATLALVWYCRIADWISPVEDHNQNSG